jgi:hypothetical protein
MKSRNMKNIKTIFNGKDEDPKIRGMKRMLKTAANEDKNSISRLELRLPVYQANILTTTPT